MNENPQNCKVVPVFRVLFVAKTDIKHREAIGRVRREFFKGDAPANTLLVISALADPAFLVEIEAIVPLP